MSVGRSDEKRLRDMLDAISRVRSRAADVGEAFFDDRDAQNEAIRYLTVLGEAAANLSLGLREAHPEVPWAGMIGMRNELVHCYFRIELSVVWETIAHDLAALEPQLRVILGGSDGVT